MARMMTQAALEATPRTARLRMVTDTQEMVSPAPPVDEVILQIGGSLELKPNVMIRNNNLVSNEYQLL